MLPSESYRSLGEEPGTPTSVGQFLTLCLLGAREEAGLPSNEHGFDEDVNVYLSGLLLDFLQPAFHAEVARFLHASDHDLSQALRRCADERTRYRAYRANADHLLLGIGLFHHVDSARGLFAREPREFVGRSSTYYQLAGSSLRRLRRRATALEIAMTKLADDLERYVEILRRVRTSYFHLTERLGEGSLFHLANSVPAEHLAAERTALYDRFLDCFSAFQSAQDARTHAELADAVEQLRAHDPEFAFELPAAP